MNYMKTKKIIEKPNENTLKAFKEADDIVSGRIKAKRYKSVTQLRKDLNI